MQSFARSTNPQTGYYYCGPIIDGVRYQTHYPRPLANGWDYVGLDARSATMEPLLTELATLYPEMMGTVNARMTETAP
jgi:hypothetical protein